MHQFDSPFSEEVVKKIRSRQTNDDRVVSKTTKKSRLEGYPFAYTHGRPLPKSTATKAMKYIRAIAAAYPVETRYGIAKPLWDRFCSEWCDTGDERKSLRAI